jgi:hypothetical protein
VNSGGLGDAPAAGAAAGDVVGNCVAVAPPFIAALAGVGDWPEEPATAASTKRLDRRSGESFMLEF